MTTFTNMTVYSKFVDTYLVFRDHATSVSTWLPPTSVTSPAVLGGNIGLSTAMFIAA